jgi:hypothetical protein
MKAWLTSLGVSSVLLLIVAIYSALNYGIDPKHCDGNYIVPGYMHTGFQSSNPILDKRYGLVRHHENGLDVPGIPVLFLPGLYRFIRQRRNL